MEDPDINPEPEADSNNNEVLDSDQLDTFGERIESNNQPEPFEPQFEPGREPDYIPIYREHDEFGEWLLR